MDQLEQLERELVQKINKIVATDKDCREFNRLPGLLEALALVRHHLFENDGRDTG